jgi:hypothetical protein
MCKSDHVFSLAGWSHYQWCHVWCHVRAILAWDVLPLGQYQGKMSHTGNKEWKCVIMNDWGILI